MAIIKCSDCREKVSSTARTCPKCGIKVQKPIPVIALLMLSIISIWGIYRINNYYDSSSSLNAPISEIRIQTPSVRSTTESEENPDTTLDEEWQKLAWIDKGKDIVRAGMRAPSSVVFRNEYFNRGELGTPVACGEVNAKNGFGAYIGFQRFISAGSDKFTFLESEVVDFSTLWRTLCL